MKSENGFVAAVMQTGRQSRRGSASALKRRRRALARATGLMVEKLEERCLLSLPTGLVDGLNNVPTDITNALTPIQTQVTSLLSKPLPIVGSQLGSAFTGWSDSLSSLATSIGTAFNGWGGDISTLEQNLVTQLDPSGYEGGVKGLLPLAGGLFPANECILTPSNGNTTKVEFELPLTQTLVATTSSLNFDAGLPSSSLPLSLTTAGNVKVSLGYTFQLNFGYDTTLGNSGDFFIDLAPSNTQTGFVGTGLTVQAKITFQGANATGKLGFLELKASDHTTNDGFNGTSGDIYGSTLFDAMFTVGLTDSNTLTNYEMPLEDIGSSAMGVNMTLSGNANLNLDLVVSFGGSTEFPSLDTLFHLDWPFSASTINSATTTANTGGTPTFGFSDVRISLGSFLNNFIQPIAQDLNNIIGPFEPVVNFLDQPMPVVNSIGPLKSLLGGSSSKTYTIADFIQLLDPSSDLGNWVSFIQNLETFCSSFDSGGFNGNDLISLGSFNLNGFDARAGAALSSFSLPSVDLSALSPDEIASAVNNVGGEASDFIGDLTNDFDLSGLGGDATDAGGATADTTGGKLDFPILDDPMSAFGLLTGSTSVNLVTFTMPTVSVSIPLSIFVPILGPIGVTIAGDADGQPPNVFTASANLSGGYDTTGIVQFARDNFNPSDAVNDLVQGLYINENNSNLKVSMGLAIEGGINVGLASVAVGGGVYGSFTFSLQPDPSGKIRWSDISSDLSAGDLFVVSGEIDANGFITASGPAGTPTVTYNFANTTIASISSLTNGKQGGGTPTPTDPTTIAVTPSLAHPIAGKAGAYDATVSSTDGLTPTGDVVFTMTGTTVTGTLQTITSTAVPLLNGVAAVPIPYNFIGYETVTAQYLGDNTHEASSTGQPGPGFTGVIQVVPGVIYVDASNKSTHEDGQSWATAFNNLNVALNADLGEGGEETSGDIIYVAGGQYGGAHTLLTGVTLIGGFKPGGSTAADPSEYVTTLNGDGGEVLQLSGGSEQTVVSGFTITGGSASQRVLDLEGDGAGIRSTNITVANCIFTGNAGGAVYINDSSPTFVDCAFTNNTATQGSAIYDTGGQYAYLGQPADSAGADPAFVNCTFSNNTAAGTGGAIYNEFYSTATVTNCILWGDVGGEIYNNTTFHGGYFDDSRSILEFTDVDQSNLFHFPTPGLGNNLDQNPNFAPGGLELQWPSPCIGKGENAAIAEYAGSDLAGNPRVAPTGGNVDMGAYEYQGPFIIYVDQHARGANNGGSWANAFNSLGAALAAASPGFTIDVAQGDYSPGLLYGTFQLIDGVTIQGGFPTGGSATPQPGLYASTFLDGADAGASVVTGSGTDSSAVLSGFVIENGTGSGISDVNGSPTIVDCTIKDNSAVNGGGMDNTSDSSPTLWNCVFVNNSASQYGGAIQNYAASDPTLINCTFTDNSAGQVGGAMVDSSGCTPHLYNCILWTDSAVESAAQWGGPTNEVVDIDSTAYYSQCDNQDGAEADGNINLNPQFVSATDLQLLTGSPAINTGALTVALNKQINDGYTTDIVGNPRLTNGQIDMGACQNSGATGLVFTQQPTNALINNTITPYIRVAFEENGVIDTNYSNIITLSIADGAYTNDLNGTLVVRSSQGQVLFNTISLGAPGSYTLMAADASGLAVTSSGFNVSIVGAQTQLAFAAPPPAVAVIGQPLATPVVVDVQQFGKTIDEHSLVTLAVGPNNVGAAYTTAGVATIDSLLFPTGYTPGNYTVVAEDGSYLTASFNITLGYPVTLIPGPLPDNIIVGDPIDAPPLTVAVDVNGQPASQYDSQITLTVLSGPGTVTSDQTDANGNPLATVDLTSGIATFDGVTFSQSGNYILQATDSASGVTTSLPVTVEGTETLVFTQQPQTYTVSGSPIAPVTVTLEDNNGNPITGIGDTILITGQGPTYSNYGGQTQLVLDPATGSVTFFNLYVGVAATDDFLEATDLNNTQVISGTSNTFVVNPGATAGFAVTTAGASAGAPANVTVQATDELGNDNTDYAGDVTLTVTDLSGHVVEALTAAAQGGMAAFNNIILTSAGEYILLATDSNLGVAGSTGMQITPAQASQLVFIQQPSSTSSGYPIAPPITVAVQDQFGNAVTGDTATVTLSVTGAGGVTLGGDVSAVVQNGVATFDNVYVGQAGTFTLTANDDAGDALATSSSFSTFAPVTIDVDRSATSGANNGRDWHDAFTTLQAALAEAIPGDTIDIAQGDYTLGGDPTATFQLLDGVTIQGGFQTGGLGGPNPSLDPTILDGAGYNYHVVTADGTDSSAVLEGVTITGGNATAGVPDGPFGGGLIADGGSPTIVDCTFVSNTALYGGAVYSANNGANAPSFVDCSFVGNFAIYSGGAVYLVASSPTLVNDLFVGNSAGAVFNLNSSPTITNCTFTGNTNGAIVDDEFDGSSPILTNCILWNDNGLEITDRAGAATVNYCDVEYGYGGNVNLSVDPQFARIFNLQIGSPCLQIGDAAAPGLAGISTDLAGQPRFQDGLVDLGAYEGAVPAVIYVDASATGGANNGLSWASAFTNLQSAFSAALPGYTIEIAQGDYSPGSDPADTFQLEDGVTIQGGYQAGGLNGPDPVLYPTILDGQNTNYSVVTASGTDSTAVLEGVTIKNGNGAADGSYGGGMTVQGGSPSIADCIFTNNSAQAGGAIYMTGDGGTLTDCIFADNTSTYNGGAIYDFIASPTLINCLFYGNSAGTRGGAVSNYIGASPTFTNCTFTDNTAGIGGAFDNEGGSVPTLTNCILWNDTGGEINNDNTSGTFASYNDIDGSSIGVIGADNINADPQFAGPGVDNFQLDPTSPCINAGTNTAADLADVFTDLAGNARIVDGAVDMGANEAVVVAVTWTGNGDGINWSDPANWSTGAVPTPNDSVSIGSGFNTIDVSAGDFSAYAISSQSPLEITTGTLQIGLGSPTGSSSGDIINDGSVTLDASGVFYVVGNVSGTGTFNVDQGAAFQAVNFSQAGGLLDNGLMTITGTGVIGGLTGTGALTLGPSARLQLAQGTPGVTSTIGTLAINTGGSLDITNNTLRAAESNVSLAQLTTWVQNGSIMSSLVTGPHAMASRAVGYGDHSGDPLTVPAGDVEVTYVPTGDANLDGHVDITDLTRAINNLGHSAGYSGGDVLKEGIVNIYDVAAIINDLGAHLNGIGDSAGVTASGAAAVANSSAVKSAATGAVIPSSGASVSAIFSDTTISADWLEPEASVLAG
jgi:predicted outer membrane repeat protein